MSATCNADTRDRFLPETKRQPLTARGSGVDHSVIELLTSNQGPPPLLQVSSHQSLPNVSLSVSPVGFQLSSHVCPEVRWWKTGWSDHEDWAVIGVRVWWSAIDEPFVLTINIERKNLRFSSRLIGLLGWGDFPSGQGWQDRVLCAGDHKDDITVSVLIRSNWCLLLVMIMFVTW